MVVAEELTARPSAKAVMLFTEAVAEVFDLAVTHFMGVAVEVVTLEPADHQFLADGVGLESPAKAFGRMESNPAVGVLVLIAPLRHLGPAVMEWSALVSGINGGRYACCFGKRR